MKHNSHSELAFFNRRFLISLFFSSLSVSFGLVALGAISGNTGTKQPTRAPQTLRTKAAVQSQSSNALGHNRNRYLDDKGNRAVGFKSENPLGVKHPRKRPMGTSAWTSLGPPGGDVFDVAASTLDSNIVLAGIAPGGSFGGTLYRSTDGGDTWSEVTALDGTSVFDIEFAPDGTTYIATQDSVRKSTDGGISWATLNLGIGANDQVFDLTIDPSNSSNLWIGVADAAGSQPVNTMRSTDGGATWIDRTPPHAPTSGRGVAVDPNDSNTVIAVFGGDFGGGEAWVTTDGGDSWADRSTGLPGNPLNAVVYDGTRLLVGGGLLFGSQFVGLYQSPDLGVTWTALHDGTWPILVVEDIAVDPDDSDRIFVAIDGGGVNRTTDGGASWQIGVGNTQALAGRSIRFQPGNSQELFLGTSSLAVFRSTNGGDTFVQSSEGISELDLFSIDANPLDPNELAVAFQGQNNGGLLSSADGGTSWQLESAPPTRYSAVRFAPDGTLYAISTGPSTVAQEGLYRREDNGTWTPLGPDQGSLYESDLNTMRFSLNDPNLILLGGEDFGVAGFEGTIWRSTDAGDSWTKVYEVGDFHRITDIEIIEDGSDQNMVAVWNSESGDNIGGALRSTDNGASWFDSSSGLPGFFRGPRLCASPSDPQSLVVAASISFASGELFRTTDSGASWASTGFTATQTLGDVACHPVDDQVLFITQLSGGDAVLRSQDGGASFEPFANGLENVVAPRELAFAGNSRLLLASAKGSYGTELTTGTPTPTPSVTPSSTPTPTVTPSSTPTPSVTPTPIITPTPTTTPRATPRPRPTPHPRPTPPG
jgi:photosystem II stability/assembly factor-like uncharacterized protein